MKISWIPYKPLIGKLLKIILPSNTIVPILQGRLRGKKWIIGSSNIECALGSYEYEKRILFEKTVSKSSVVYDIGAHVGFYTLLASELVGSGKVIAFEPVPRNLKYLKKHLKINNCTNVIVIEAAVSDKSDITHFKDSPNSSMGHLSENGDLTINTVSIDELVGNGKIPAPDYMKIDVEGSELLVLKGAKSVLIDYSPKIFLATHSHRVPNVHIDCCDFLASLGYKLKPIIGNDLYATREIFACKDDNYTDSETKKHGRTRTMRYLIPNNSKEYLKIILKVKQLPFFLKYQVYQFLHPDYPWLTQRAVSFLNQELRPYMKGFEWGSGRSTIFFSSRVNRLVSVEHDYNWFNKVSSIIEKRSIKNVNLNCFPTLNEEEVTNLDWFAVWPGYRYINKPPKKPIFLNYFNAINDYPDNYFDFVLVDGRARVPCMLNAMSKLKTGGLMILDNSDRVEYREVFHLFKNWKRISTTNHLWETDIWIKPMKGKNHYEKV